MNNGLDLAIIPIIMPILAAVIVLIISVLLIMVFYKKKQSLSIQSFEKLSQELKADNKILKTELETIKETLDSINKMMKEIE